MYFDFLNLVHVPLPNIKEAAFMIYTAASHQGVIKMLWTHFLGAFISSIFMHSLC